METTDNKPSPEVLAAVLESAVFAFKDNDNKSKSVVLDLLEISMPELRVVRVTSAALNQAGVAEWDALHEPFPGWMSDLCSAVLFKATGKTEPGMPLL